MAPGATIAATSLHAATGSARPLTDTGLLRRVAVHVLGPLLLGGAVYLLWRTPEPGFVNALRPLGVGRLVDGLRQAAAPLGPYLPAWLLVNLPDGLWTYTLTALVAIIWRRGPARVRRAWLGGVLVFALAFELGQLLRLVPGSFDPVDLCVIGAAWAVALSTLGRERSRGP